MSPQPSNSLKRRIQLASSAAGVALLAGCAVVNEIQNDIVESFDAVDPPASQAEAASTHVAVVAVAPWDEYAKAIQPTFALTPADALTQAIPATASFQSRIVDAIRLGVQAGLPTSGTTETLTENTDAAGVQTTTSSRETRSAPGTLPARPGFLGQVPGAGTLQFPTTGLGEDPFLKYSIATDLYEEVQILNRALADAKIRDQVEPYFLRIKVALLPSRRELRYDAFSDIDFFLRKSDPEAIRAAIAAGAAPIDAQERAAKLLTVDPETQIDTVEQRLADPALPIVVPLLVTDNLESASDAASAQFIAELAAALSGSAQGAAVGAQLNSLGDRLTAALANERNSLRTVGRLGENAIRVRFGATLQASRTGRKDYELLARTHTLSLLVLVPHKSMLPGVPPRLGLFSRTSLREVSTGRPLERFRGERFRAGLQEIVDGLQIQKHYDRGGKKCIEYGTKTFRAPYDWVNWIRFTFVLYGDYKNYFDRAKCMFSSGASIDSDYQLQAGEQIDIDDLWIELLDFNAEYAASAQTIDLPAIERPALPPKERAVILTDNGKDATVARLLGGAGLVATSLDAELHFRSTGSAPTIHLPADAIAVDERGVSATFPSLAVLQLAAKGDLIRRPELALKHRGDSIRPGPEPESYTSILYTAGENAKKSDPELKPDIPATRVVATAGEGKLTIGIQLKPGVPPQPAFIRIEGAEIDAASGGEIDELGVVKVVSSGRYTLSLRNLAPTARVTATVYLVKKDKAGKEIKEIKGPKELEVVEAPRREQTARAN